MIRELRQLNTSIAIRLEMAVMDRVKERRLKEAATLLAYLRDPKFIDNLPSPNKILSYANKKEVANLARDLYIRLFQKATPAQNQSDENQDHSQSDPTEEEQDEAPAPKRNRSKELYAQLQLSKQKAAESLGTMPMSGSVTAAVLNQIMKEMQLFEARGERGTMLAQIYRALLSVPVTSCEAERGGIH